MNSTEASQASLGSLTGLKSFETGKQLILRQFPMLIFQTWCIDLSAHRHNTRISSKIPKNPMSLVIILETNFSSNCIDNWRRLCDPSLRQLYPHISDDKDTNSESIVLSIHLYYNHRFIFASKTSHRIGSKNLWLVSHVYIIIWSISLEDTNFQSRVEILCAFQNKRTRLGFIRHIHGGNNIIYSIYHIVDQTTTNREIWFHHLVHCIRQ